ncbi:YkuS family protein [Aquibacillus rhizosphaerae]|uniref:UPF0180 protein QQS35_17075 n=1 Tax=Aquibacillus rhizosphaerae TaxID=3051431 RepID=A0ABT7L8G2_9BACI|nr:YkuS family protein [Aquibacillus sp. LR5S19]MDL4842153.1 YkuS family protein [Aquibacillus sp. LR5S19]
MTRIGIEGTLSDVKGALQEKGYDVVDLRQEEDVNGCDCCVISGQDKNVMGMQTASFDGSVINAQGLTADEVCEQVEQKIK